ncbi:transcriptional regulator [Williamsia sterculiae]|uniref:DNA-binding transcriptional regulator of glucitol operon n=1 Tax=Williamsia sterculiae TaxID=1344003 RepID=A0A1N7HG53_9NOCA|nr:transcriptional regulator [Williamsia sterculiae]SIS23753.1 DNA-binding transcriptional regulator of glucitol operon [Williamsia sterculiae]
MAAGTRRHRPALIALVVVAAVVCLGMAWWQWDRYESTSGTGQNLGYALQWPMFAAAFVYAYRRFVVLENDPDEVEKLHPAPGEMVAIPEDLLPERPKQAASVTVHDDSDPEDRAAADYNRYLAALAEQEKK